MFTLGSKLTSSSKGIVDKTANYVANSPHGPLLEEKIREKERANAKFAFLNSADAYHGYYRWKSERIKAGDKEGNIISTI